VLFKRPNPPAKGNITQANKLIKLFIRKRARQIIIDDAVVTKNAKSHSYNKRIAI